MVEIICMDQEGVNQEIETLQDDPDMGEQNEEINNRSSTHDVFLFRRLCGTENDYFPIKSLLYEGNNIWLQTSGLFCSEYNVS